MSALQLTEHGVDIVVLGIRAHEPSADVVRCVGPESSSDDEASLAVSTDRADEPRRLLPTGNECVLPVLWPEHGFRIVHANDRHGTVLPSERDPARLPVGFLDPGEHFVLEDARPRYREAYSALAARGSSSRPQLCRECLCE